MMPRNRRSHYNSRDELPNHGRLSDALHRLARDPPAMSSTTIWRCRYDRGAMSHAQNYHWLYLDRNGIVLRFPVQPRSPARGNHRTASERTAAARASETQLTNAFSLEKNMCLRAMSTPPP